MEVKNEGLSNWYFTFGQGKSHRLKTGASLYDYWVRVVAKTEMEARHVFFDKFAAQYMNHNPSIACQYSEAEFEPWHCPKGEFMCIEQETNNKTLKNEQVKTNNTYRG